MNFMIKRVWVAILALQVMQVWAESSGNLFNVTTSGLTLAQPAGFTLCLSVNGQNPLSCQDYTTNRTTLSIRTTLPHHTYHYAGIRMNTGGYIVTAQGLRGVSFRKSLTAEGFTPFQVSDTQAATIIVSSQGQATLQISITDLALSITGYTEYGVTGNPSSGHARVINVTNTSTSNASNLSVSATGLPTGTTITAVPTTCTGTLAPNASCTVTVTPGATATSNCTAGTTPTPGAVSISSSNANTVSTNVTILGYGCIYRGGYVFALDDTTATSGSVAGKVAAQANEAGLSSWGPFGGTVAVSNTDGVGNTDILANLAGPYPAAVACYHKTTDGYTDWYLPAICEMGYYDGSPPDPGCGTSGTPTLQNMQSNLVDYNTLNLLFGITWSSTQFSAFFAWEHFFAAGSGGQGNFSKDEFSQVRCVRGFNP